MIHGEVERMGGDLEMGWDKGKRTDEKRVGRSWMEGAGTVEG